LGGVGAAVSGVALRWRESVFGRGKEGVCRAERDSGHSKPIATTFCRNSSQSKFIEGDRGGIGEVKTEVDRV